MTRINLVPVNELSDQHLLAEYRELPRIFGLVKKAQEKGLRPVDCDIPESYRMGTGHVKFFYDKLMFLVERHMNIVNELVIRGVQIQNLSCLMDSSIPSEWYGNFKPSPEDIEVSRQRIEEKLQAKPNFYRYYQKPFDMFMVM